MPTRAVLTNKPMDASSPMTHFGTSKEQKTEHPVQQCRVEINLGDQLLGHIDALFKSKSAQYNQYQGEKQRNDHDADRGRQLECVIVEPRKKRRHGYQETGYR